MTNSQRLATVRARFLAWLAHESTADADGRPANAAIVRETILIRQEFYCGRRFHTTTHYAVWFIEEDELKIFRKDGQLACVLSSDQINQMVSDDQPQLIRLPQRPSASAGDEARRAA